MFNLAPKMNKVYQFHMKDLRPTEKYNKMTISCMTGVLPVCLLCPEDLYKVFGKQVFDL